MKNSFFHICFGFVLLTVLLAGIQVSAKFAPARAGGLVPAESLVTARQMELASPWRGQDEQALYTCLQRARARKKMTAAFIGSSITKGKMAEGTKDGMFNEKLSYVEYFARWWQDSFPQIDLDVVNAGISATDSYLGVHRVQKDVLDKNPDLVVVEFAVNDQDTDLHKQAYENLVRKLLDADPKPAVLLLFTSRVNGENCQDAQAQIGEYYHLPMVSYANVMNDMLRHGIYTAGQLSGDGVHPSALGSAVIGELLARYMDGIFQKEAGSIQAGTRPSVYMTSREYEHAGILSCRELDINHMGTFRKVNKSRYFPGNLESSNGSGGLEFTVACKNLGFLYVRQKDGSGGQFDVYVDGSRVSEINADNYGAHNNQPGTVSCFFSEKKSRHTVRIVKKKGSAGDELILYGVLVSE